MWTHCCPAGVNVTSALLLFIVSVALANAETYVEDSGRVPLTLGGHRWRSLCLQTVRFPV